MEFMQMPVANICKPFKPMDIIYLKDLNMSAAAYQCKKLKGEMTVVDSYEKQRNLIELYYSSNPRDNHICELFSVMHHFL